MQSVTAAKFMPSFKLGFTAVSRVRGQPLLQSVRLMCVKKACGISRKLKKRTRVSQF